MIDDNDAHIPGADASPIDTRVTSTTRESVARQQRTQQAQHRLILASRPYSSLHAIRRTTGTLQCQDRWESNRIRRMTQTRFRLQADLRAAK